MWFLWVRRIWRLDRCWCWWWVWVWWWEDSWAISRDGLYWEGGISRYVTVSVCQIIGPFILRTYYQKPILQRGCRFLRSHLHLLWSHPHLLLSPEHSSFNSFVMQPASHNSVFSILTQLAFNSVFVQLKKLKTNVSNCCFEPFLITFWNFFLFLTKIAQTVPIDQ